MGGLLFFGYANPQEKQPQKDQKQKLDKVDVVNFQLKQARDRIKKFINSKNRDLNEIETKIRQAFDVYKQTENKKELIPLLKTKKDLLKIIDSGDVRLNLIKEKMAEVQIQKMNADVINVLEDSNKYIQEIQEHLEEKDWKQVLEDATKKYQIQFPDSEQAEEDPAFQKMWEELGGEKLGQTVQKKKVHVLVHAQRQQQNNKLQEIPV